MKFFYFLLIISGLFFCKLWGQHEMPVESMDDILKSAWVFYHQEKWAEAENAFKRVQEQMPMNPEAAYGLCCVNEALMNVAQLAYAKTRAQILKESEDKWQLPDYKTTFLDKVDKNQDSAFNDALLSFHLDKLSFCDTPLNRVLDYMGELASQKNIQLGFMLLKGDQKVPNLTLTVRDVSFKIALQYIARACGYQIEYEDTLIIFRPAEGPAGEILENVIIPISRGSVSRLTGLQDKMEKLGSGMPLESIKLVKPTLMEEEKALKAFFERAGIPFYLEKCTLAFDGTTLFITHTERYIKKLKAILAHYDTTYQVEIEAKFMEVNQGDLEELGFQWHMSHGSEYMTTQGLAHHNSLRSLGDAFTKNSSVLGDGVILQSDKASRTISNFPPAIPGNINVGALSPNIGNFLGKLGGWDVNMVVRALEQTTGADLMSAPKLTVLSGKTAEIIVAREFRYPESYGPINSAVGMSSSLGTGSSAGVTITAGTPQNFVTRRVGVQMEVTPIVEDSGEWISLCLEPKVTEFEGFVEYGGSSVAISGETTVQVPSGFYQPIFSTREMRTEVTIANGATVVMGGLTREEKKSVHDAVPVLSKLPILGRLFESKGETNQKRSLLIFVTGTVIEPSGNQVKYVK